MSETRTEKKAVLVLSDGTVFEGRGFGAEGEAIGEAVFNTSMTGYQEVLTDPSYHGQMVVMTAPHIGNTGLNEEDDEADRPYVRGFIVKEASRLRDNYRSTSDLDDYLIRHRIPGIEGIDTRALTRHIRDHGAQQAVLSTADLTVGRLLEKVRSAPGLVGRDLVREVTSDKVYEWTEGLHPLAAKPRLALPLSSLHVVAYDFGIKRNILRQLVSAGCRVTVVPAGTSAEEALALKPDGILLSNGPGDPEGVPYVIKTVQGLLGKRPIFGICLGHQILGLALGGRTYKLKFGHHGGNQPVMDLTTRKSEVTVHNHGFSVDVQSLGRSVEVTHVNLNDQTVEGMRHRELPVFSVQYHPEAAPGPHDANYLFSRFKEMMQNG